MNTHLYVVCTHNHNQVPWAEDWRDDNTWDSVTCACSTTLQSVAPTLMTPGGCVWWSIPASPMTLYPQQRLGLGPGGAGSMRSTSKTVWMSLRSMSPSTWYWWCPTSRLARMRKTTSNNKLADWLFWAYNESSRKNLVPLPVKATTCGSWPAYCAK